MSEVQQDGRPSGSTGSAGLLGLAEFRLLAVDEHLRELEFTVETTELVVGCRGCGTQAELPEATTRVRDHGTALVDDPGRTEGMAALGRRPRSWRPRRASPPGT
jgi:hypothetical protein